MLEISEFDVDWELDACAEPLVAEILESGLGAMVLNGRLPGGGGVGRFLLGIPTTDADAVSESLYFATYNLVKFS